MISPSDKFSEALKALNSEQLSAFSDDYCDSACTAGYDNDGSTGYEIFSNGASLAQEAAGRPITSGERRGTDGATAYFVIGTGEDALRLVATCVRDNPAS